jgi:hypothetical protein
VELIGHTLAAIVAEEIIQPPAYENGHRRWWNPMQQKKNHSEMFRTEEAKPPSSGQQIRDARLNHK